MVLDNQITGYIHHKYVESFVGFGSPLHLPCSGGWILESPIPGSSSTDARGCYPLFACRNWSGLVKDISGLPPNLVSLLVVTDPFGSYCPEFLNEIFPDLCRPYKQHFVVDLSIPVDRRLAKHHARNVRKSQNDIAVERCADPIEHAQVWANLYESLIKRHGITGVAAFCRRSLKEQIKVPGLEMFRGQYKGETVGVVLFYVQGDIGYYHLAAYSEAGYRLRASYSIFAFAFDYFSTRLRWVNLGAGAGIDNDGNDGLTRFKRGWATGTRTAFICGRIFSRRLYDEIARRRGMHGNDYFPIYRKGEILSHCEE